LQHSIGVERVTAIRLVKPKEYQPVAAFTYLQNADIFKSSEGAEWAIELRSMAGAKPKPKICSRICRW